MNYQEGKQKIKRFKVKLDHKTVIWLNSMSSFLMWKERYPQAEIVNE